MTPIISRAPHGPARRSLLWIRAGLAAIGVATWFYGVRAQDTRVRWLGIAFLAVAFALRFVRRGRPPQS